MAQRWTAHQPCTLLQMLNDLGILVEEHKMKLKFKKKCNVLHVTRMKQIPAWPSLAGFPSKVANLTYAQNWTIA